MWQKLLTTYDLSYIVPITTGIVQIVVLIASYFIFHETITITDLIGLVFVTIGIVLISIKVKKGFSSMYDVIIVGAGFAGSVLAEKFASDNKKVLVIDKRNHIGGNMYEETRSNGVRVHKSGPHIFHTNDKEVFDYLPHFTGFYF